MFFLECEGIPLSLMSSVFGSSSKDSMSEKKVDYVKVILEKMPMVCLALIS